MGVQGFQDYIEKHCPSAVVPVELQKLARGSLTPLRLLIDADNCLHRLYGGFYTDWVSGGQWNHMLGYLAALAKACFNGNIELFVFFNGALEKARLHEWVKRQGNERQTAQQIVSHVQNKGTPPPKVWFLPPVCMAHCIRLALIRFHIKVAQSIEDHHQEVIAFCREKGFHGLVAYDSDYALCNIPYYFSAHALKLSRNGKSLTTSQYLMHEVAKQLDLNPNRFPIFAALLGNHILPDEDLASFHWSLLGPEHPLASLKVRAHQLVLPPCDVVIKAVADYVRNIQDTTDLDAIAKDVFQHSQSRTDDKVTRFKRAVAYYSATNKPMPFHPPHYIAARPNQFGMPGIVPPYVPSQMLNIPQTSLQAKPVAQQMSNQGGAQGQGPYPYSLSEPAITLETGGKNLSEQNNYSNIPHEGKHTPLYERSSPINPAQSGSPNHVDSTYFPASSTSSSSDNDEGNGGAAEGSSSASSGSQAADVKGNQTSNPQIPCLLSMPTRNHMDITTPPLPPVAPEVLRVAEHRHKKGLMYPYIFHVLTKVWHFKNAYQKVYHLSVLVAYPLLLEADCPVVNFITDSQLVCLQCDLKFNFQSLWYFVCFKNSTGFLCRYMVQWPGVRILRRQELDAFLAQALSPKLYEPDQLQELKIENLDPRGIQLSALFMSGVDMALFANDACGQPIPWEHCCPWMYFDGKLFQTKLIKASREKVPLIDLCDGQAEQAAKVEKMRQSILEGLNFSRQNHPLPFPPPPAMPFYPASMYPRHFGPVPPPQGRGRGFAGVYGFGGPYGETVATGAYRAFRVAAAAGHSGAFSGNDSNRTSKFQGGNYTPNPFLRASGNSFLHFTVCPQAAARPRSLLCCPACPGPAHPLECQPLTPRNPPSGTE
uniref:Family with sequence similarity 120A n=1 Tax=Pavo cristatus TaxID=9049 RepID=A0A8C9G825_PAVCR